MLSKLFLKIVRLRFENHKLREQVTHQDKIIQNLKSLVKSVEDELNELKQQVKDGVAA